MVFGSGVAGLSVLTHMHTPPLLTSQWQKKLLPSLPKGFYSLHDCARAVTHSPLRRPPELLFILSQERKWLTFMHFWLRAFSPLSVRCSPAQDFPGFYPRSFPLWIYMTVAVSFPHGWICGSCVVVSLTYKLGEL